MSLDQTPINQLITDNIDTWTSTVKTKATTGRGSSKKLELYGVKKLRELILELAVRGKLVPQDPSDEPASVLLEHIATKKAKLIKEKKIKRQKSLGDVAKEEELFDTPDGWVWTRISEIAEIGPRNNATNDDDEVSFVPMPLITTNYDGSHGSEKRVWKEIKKGYTHFQNGDIALAKITPCFENSKAAVFSGLEGGVGSGTTELHVARPVPDLFNPRFVLLYLKAPMFLKVGETKMTGSAGQKRVPKDFFSGNPLPFPPSNEQHRIVAKVDELMTLCDQLEQQTEASIAAHQVLVTTLLDTLTSSANAEELMQNWQMVAEHFDTLFTTEESIDQLKQTILQLAVMGKLVPQDPNDEPAAKLLERIAIEKAQLIKEKKIKKQKALPPITDDEKPFELPSGWEWERVGTFGVVGTGATPSRSNPKYWDSPDHNWVSSGETANLFVGQTKEKVSELAIKETNVSVYPVGTLIVAMYGQGKTRGQVTELSEPAGTNQACAAISLIEPNTAHKDFVKLYFRKSYEELRSNAAGGAQPNLNVSKVQNTIIAVPPLAEQHRINAKVHSLLELCESLKCNLSKAQVTQHHLTDAIVEQAV